MNVEYNPDLHERLSCVTGSITFESLVPWASTQSKGLYQWSSGGIYTAPDQHSWLELGNIRSPLELSVI